MAYEQDKIDIDRLHNLISNFGWTIAKQESMTDKIVLTIEKKRTAGPGTESATPG